MIVKRCMTVLSLFMVAITTCAPANDDRFIQLFNRKDITGWKTSTNSRWVVEDGVLTLKDRSDGLEHNNDYLWTDRPYGDFILDLEFKIPVRANSGIFLRTSDLSDPVQTGIEVQICNSYGRKNLNRGNCAGAIYDCLAPTKNTVKKPGEWNRCTVTCNDNKILVVLNAEQVIDMDLNQWKYPYRNPGGTKNKFRTALRDFARRGYIGFQDHGTPVWYRNIRIKPLGTGTVSDVSGCAPANDDGFIQLFNGENLSNWQNADGGKPSAGWVVENSALVRKPGAGMIWSKERFGNFVLDLDFKTEGNSGIFFRTDNPKDCVQTGLEMQVYRPVKKPGKYSCGAIYDALSPSKEMTRDGQWNHVTITAVDNNISIVLNGVQIIDMDLNRWTKPHKNPDESDNKFRTALKDFKREGHIGFQDHGAPVWYRNIRIKPLGTETVSDVSDSVPAISDTGRIFTLARDPLGMVLKTPDGRTVFRYMTKKPAETKLTANSVCCLYPLNTPLGERVVDFAPSDHPHHRGLFLAWHSITARKAGKKADFWGWGAWAPTEGRLIKNSSVKLLQSDSQHVSLRVANDWIVGNVKMIDEILFIVARQEKSAYVIDLNFHLTPAMDVTLDKTAFGGLCAKGRKDGEGSYYSPGGLAELPAPHHLKPESDWPAADWYDYTVKLNSGKTVGVAVLDHPVNPPTTWHNLAPISMLNPCIVAPGPVAIKKRQTLNLRYRIIVHDGPPPVELLKKLNSEWRRKANPKPFKLEPGFTRLDNGKDLTGWFGSTWFGNKTGDTTGWSVVDGAIHLDSEAAKNHLFNENTYSKNAIIRLQFRADRVADSGLCIHGRQLQVRDYPNALPDTDKYAPFCNPSGQWNDMELDITDSVAVIKLNGHVIEKAWKTGTAPDRGLGLQKELGSFDFRYIRLKEKK